MLQETSEKLEKTIKNLAVLSSASIILNNSVVVVTRISNNKGKKQFMFSIVSLLEFNFDNSFSRTTYRLNYKETLEYLDIWFHNNLFGKFYIR